MKVALVDVNYGSSSTGKIVADLVAGLNRRGHRSTAFYGRGDAASEADGVRRISSPWEVRFHALATRVTGLTDGFSPLATSRLIRELERLKPDVVHLHDIHGYFLNIGALCAYLKQRRIATVWTFHCEFMYTGRCGYAMECEGWRTGCQRCPDLTRYPASWFLDFAGRMFADKQALFADFERLALAAPSHWLAKRMGESLVGNRPVEVVPNGLDTSVFRPRDVATLRAEMGIQGKYCVLALGAGLLSERKGGRWVIELARRFAGEEVAFLMVGVDQIPAVLPANVIMHPRIADQNRLAEFYSLGNVLLLPSEKETFSMVSAEALACGLPVIGFDSGAPKEVAPPGYGSFVPYGDLDGLEALLRKVRQGLGGLQPRPVCVEFAKSHYSVESMVAAYETIYQKVIQCK
jgi:putative colanic acid biosynthesis glycosyltransferase